MYEVEEHSEIKGLFYVENCIENEDIMSDIDKNVWTPITNSKNSRLVQHYGYYYNYFDKNSVVEAPKFPQHIKSLEEILHHICSELKIIETTYCFNQCIVNNYYSGQTISKHIDAKIFGKVIGCFSLKSEATMKFTRGDKHINLKVSPNSLYIMSDEARYKWTHEMTKLGKDKRRISITFRNI